jgi:hypothetical protein
MSRVGWIWGGRSADNPTEAAGFRHGLSATSNRSRITLDGGGMACGFAAKGQPKGRVAEAKQAADLAAGKQLRFAARSATPALTSSVSHSALGPWLAQPDGIQMSTRQQ